MQIQESQWFAVRVKTGAEVSVSAILNYKGYTTYVPEHRGGKKRELAARKPLFPGYVLCRSGASALGLVVTTPKVLSIVSFGGVAAEISDAEIEHVRAVEVSRMAAQPWSAAPAGTHVRVTRGPLAGVDGYFVRAPRRDLLLVVLRMLQRCVSVEIDACSLQAIECDA
jgi:transcription antitermination factor NusG